MRHRLPAVLLIVVRDQPVVVGNDQLVEETPGLTREHPQRRSFARRHRRAAMAQRASGDERDGRGEATTESGSELASISDQGAVNITSSGDTDGGRGRQPHLSEDGAKRRVRRRRPVGGHPFEQPAGVIVRRTIARPMASSITTLWWAR